MADQKQCTKCGEIKPLTEFNRRRMVSSGFRAECRECQKQSTRRYYHEGDGQRKKSEYYAAHREEKKEGFRQYFTRKRPRRPYNPEKSPARNALNRAIESGKIVRPDHCQECGKSCKPDGHHHKGYDKEHWLDVIWLCRECHSLTEHPEFKKILEAI